MFKAFLSVEVSLFSLRGERTMVVIRPGMGEKITSVIIGKVIKENKENKRKIQLILKNSTSEELNLKFNKAFNKKPRRGK